MNQKTSNEITIKIKCQLSEFYKIIEEKGFKKIRQFSMDDTYFIPLSKRQRKKQKKNKMPIIENHNQQIVAQ